MGQEGIQGIELTVEWFKENIGDIFIPLYVGTAFYSIFVTGLLYYVLNRWWVQSVHKEKSEKKEEKRIRKKQLKQEKAAKKKEAKASKRSL